MLNNKVKPWSLGGFLLCLGLLPNVPAGAQAQAEHRDFEVADAPLNESVEPRQRFSVIEEQFSRAGQWTFHHSIGELPSDLHALLIRMAGPVVVGPGESFNTGDVKSFPADSQHLYTAVAGNQAVIVWYTGTITGLKLHVVLYDRTVKDAVRYDFMNDALAAVPVGSLTGLLLNKNNQFLRWEYLPSPSP